MCTIEQTNKKNLEFDDLLDRFFIFAYLLNDGEKEPEMKEMKLSKYDLLVVS